MNPQNQQTSFPAPTSPMPSTMPVEHKKVGPIIAVLIIVLILVIGALYLFASNINQKSVPSDSTVAGTDQTTAPTGVQAITNNSDEVDSLQADLNASTQGLDGQSF